MILNRAESYVNAPDDNALVCQGIYLAAALRHQYCHKSYSRAWYTTLETQH